MLLITRLIYDFGNTATADAFRNRFGGECLTYAPDKPKPRTSGNVVGCNSVKHGPEED